MIFDELKRQNANWYTANPILAMDEKKRQQLADKLHITVDQLMSQAITPSFDSTCPLCGRPQTHLSDCKGCGSGAFSGWDFSEAYDDRDANVEPIYGTARKRIRAALKDTLTTKFGELAEYANKNTYDCMVCADCWRQTIAESATFYICPLKLFSDRIVAGSIGEVFIISAGWMVDGDHIEASYKRWIGDIWSTWIENQDKTVADWRATIVEAALNPEPLSTDKPRASVQERVQECLDVLGIEKQEE